MDAKYINPFLSAVENVLGQFGVQGIKKGAIKVKEIMTIDKEITAFVGIVGDLRGNVAYSFNSDTAMKLVSSMMGGMPVNQIDDMARSAVSELSNMFLGNAINAFGTSCGNLDITPPSVVMGEDIFFILGSTTTLMINIETDAGTIEINIGLEV